MKLSNLLSHEAVKHVFPFQAKFFKMKKKTLQRVRKKSKGSVLQRRKKVHQEEEGARHGSTEDKGKEIRRKIMEWLEKAGGSRGVESA